MTKRKVVPIAEPEVEVRPIPGYEGLYSASADGRVWSHAKSMGLSRHGGRWLKPAMRQGYPYVELFKDQKAKSMSVHRAVALAWIPNPAGLPEVNHLDGDHGNAHVSNLEWTTTSGNKLHAWRTGLTRGSRTTSDTALSAIKADLAAGMRFAHAARKHGVHPATVANIAHGRVKYATATAAHSPQQPPGETATC